MAKSLKWFSLAMACVSIIFMVFLVYTGAWISALLWAVLVVTNYMNYRSMCNLVVQQEEINARMQEMINDYRS